MVGAERPPTKIFFVLVTITSFFVGIVAAAVVDSGVNVDCGGGGGAATAVTGGLIALMVACGSGGC